MKKYTAHILIALFFIFTVLPLRAHAATISFETTKKDIYAGDTFVVTAKVDTQNQTINSIEGDVALSSKDATVVVNDFTLSKSAFTLWPRTPSLSKDGKVISFVGGVPGGLHAKDATLFSIVIEAAHEGDITITPQNIAVFANDGSGTRTPLVASATTIHIQPKNEASAVDNEWETIVRSDKKAPKPFDIVLGREASLFDGNRFAFFTAVDNESGISYYEVVEGTNPAIRSGSMYVLQNQDDGVVPSLTVTAYDKAGNKTTATYSQPHTKVLGVPLGIVIALVLVIGIVVIYTRRKKNTRSHAQPLQ